MVYSDESSMGVAGASRHGGVMRHAQSNVTLVVSILVELEMQSIKMGDPQRKATVIKNTWCTWRVQSETSGTRRYSKFCNYLANRKGNLDSRGPDACRSSRHTFLTAAKTKFFNRRSCPCSSSAIYTLPDSEWQVLIPAAC